MISPLAHVDPSAKIGQNVKIYPFAFIDKDVEVGDNCEIYPYASLMPGTRMGKDCRVFQGSIISAEPQDFRFKGDASLCVIGDKVTIREHHQPQHPSRRGDPRRKRVVHPRREPHRP